MRSIAKSKDLRTDLTGKVGEVRRSFDSLTLAQDDRPLILLTLVTKHIWFDRSCFTTVLSAR